MALTNLGYVLKQDITAQIGEKTLLELTGGRDAIGDSPAVAGDDAIWENLRGNAKELVKGYMRHWYDIPTEFRPFYEYSATEEIELNTRVASTPTDGVRTLYKCIQLAPIGTLLTNTDYFEQTDDRNSVVLECVVILAIYYMFRRINPRQMPEQRQIDYDRVISILKDIQNGKITLDIAERESPGEDDPGQQMSFGNFDTITQDYY